MVRSSVNVEDFEGMFAVGLYDFILNVDLNLEDVFSCVVGEVWVFLYIICVVVFCVVVGVD